MPNPRFRARKTSLRLLQNRSIRAYPGPIRLCKSRQMESPLPAECRQSTLCNPKPRLGFSRFYDNSFQRSMSTPAHPESAICRAGDHSKDKNENSVRKILAGRYLPRNHGFQIKKATLNRAYPQNIKYITQTHNETLLRSSV